MSVIGIGRHVVRVVSHVVGKSGTGTPHVSVLFEDVNGDRITWYGYLTDKAMERTIASLQILGWDAVADNGLVHKLNGTDALVGAEAEIVVEMEEWEGKPTPKVKWVNEVGGGMAKPLPEEEAATFAASIRTKVLSAARPQANNRPGPAKQPAAAGAPAADDFDDDLPF